MFSYFNSFTFEGGINVGPVGIALKYHKVLKTAYEDISKKQTGIGMSTDWWGMFSVQLAPTFILKFATEFPNFLIIDLYLLDLIPYSILVYQN